MGGMLLWQRHRAMHTVVCTSTDILYAMPCHAMPTVVCTSTEILPCHAMRTVVCTNMFANCLPKALRFTEMLTSSKYAALQRVSRTKYCLNFLFS